MPVKRRIVAALMAYAAMTLTGLEAGAASGATTTGIAAPAYHMIRFQAPFVIDDLTRGPDGRYRPRGKLFPPAGNMPLLGSAPAIYESMVTSNVDGKGGFLDEGTIRFAAGELRFRGVYPTRNEPTVVPGVQQTVMVQKVTGGTGAFEGATGYLTINSTITKGEGVAGDIAAIIFVRAG
jgi:hypothetical protein